MITMTDILRALETGLGFAEGSSVWEWYCSSYGLTAADPAPMSVRWEVLGDRGLTDEERRAK